MDTTPRFFSDFQKFEFCKTGAKEIKNIGFLGNIS